MNFTEGLYAAITAIIVAVLGYIYNLQRKNDKLKGKVSELTVNKELAEFAKQLQETGKRIKESERDYENAVRDYNSDDDTSGGKE